MSWSKISKTEPNQIVLVKYLAWPWPFQVKKKKSIRGSASEGDISDSPRDSLTRETVIEMARKSDASKNILQRYKSLGSDEQYLDKYHSTYVINQDGFQADLAHVHDKPLTTSTPVSPRVHVTNVYQTFVTVTKGPERPLMQPVEVKITATPQKPVRRPLLPAFPEDSGEYESQTVNVSFEKPPSDDYIPIVEILLKPKDTEEPKGPEQPPSPIVVDWPREKQLPFPKKNYTVYLNGQAPVEQVEMRDLAPTKSAERNSRPTAVVSFTETGNRKLSGGVGAGRPDPSPMGWALGWGRLVSSGVVF